MHGYRGKILRINLSSGEVRWEDLDPRIINNFVGGKGLGYYLIYHEVPPSTNVFSEENKILFVPGAMSGLIPAASKVAVISISPETNMISDSYVGDRLGPFLKRWGIDAIIIEGRSDEPVYLKIGEDVEIKDAHHLWSKGTHEVSRELWKLHGNGAIALIGPGGENLVRFASIIVDAQRAAGRGGLGAVMGSKNLKGVFVSPISIEDARIEIFDKDTWMKLREEYYKKFENDPSLASLREYGTTNGLLISARRGMSPSYNFSKPYIPDSLARKLSGDCIKKYEIEPEDYIHGKSCPIKCARYVKVNYEGQEFYLKPEYESIAMLGACTGVFDFPKVAYLNHLANDLGLDTIAAGNVIGFIFEMVERGEIGHEEIGFPINGFGDFAAEEKLLMRIAYRRGIGGILAEGVKRASDILNRGREYAVHVKSLESPAWDPRGLRTYALSYATADVGASHLRGWPSPASLPNDGAAKELVPSLIESRDKDALFDSMGLCKFLPYEMEDIVSLYRTITGLNSDLKNLGWKIENIARIYSVLGGMNPIHDDSIPLRWWTPQEDGPARGNMAFRSYEDFIEARRKFYNMRGWDPDYGVPLEDTLQRLNMNEFVEDAIRGLNYQKRRCQTCSFS